jgi:hypothetical protein
VWLTIGREKKRADRISPGEGFDVNVYDGRWGRRGVKDLKASVNEIEEEVKIGKGTLIYRLLCRNHGSFQSSCNFRVRE